LLPLSQHVAKGISLAVSAPPTSVSSLAAYLRKRCRVAILAVFFHLGFVAGGPAGVLLAKTGSRQPRFKI
jgi:uncharacterized membrane protein YfcA